MNPVEVLQLSRAQPDVAITVVAMGTFHPWGGSIEDIVVTVVGGDEEARVYTGLNKYNLLLK